MDEFLAMDRRALLQRAMLLVGATSVASCTFLPGAGAAATLGADQVKLLETFADTLIPQTDTPGAIGAGVPKSVAGMYAAWASDKTREEISGALDRLDAAATKKTGKSFVDLNAADRQAFLAAHDVTSLKNVPPPEDAPKGNPFAPAVSVADNGYHKLKELVAVTYYMSQVGLTKELEYQHVPGGWTPSIKVTKDTRPAMSFGAF